MKTIAILLAAASVMSLAAADAKINGNFAGSSQGSTEPRGWTKNQSEKAPDHGISKVVAGKKAGEFALSVKTTKKITHFFTQEKVMVKPGDIVNISADVTGKGSVKFISYAYKVTGKNQPNVGGFSAKMTASAIPGTVKGTITVGAQPDCTYLRLVFEVGKDSDVVISNVKADVVSAKK